MPRHLFFGHSVFFAQFTRKRRQRDLGGRVNRVRLIVHLELRPFSSTESFLPSVARILQARSLSVRARSASFAVSRVGSLCSRPVVKLGTSLVDGADTGGPP